MEALLYAGICVSPSNIYSKSKFLYLTDETKVYFSQVVIRFCILINSIKSCGKFVAKPLIITKKPDKYTAEVGKFGSRILHFYIKEL